MRGSWRYCLISLVYSSSIFWTAGAAGAEAALATLPCPSPGMEAGPEIKVKTRMTLRKLAEWIVMKECPCRDSQSHTILMQVAAAVAENHLPGDHLGIVAGNERNQCGQVVRLNPALDRLVLHHAVKHLF